MARIEKSEMSNYLRENLPDRFYLEEEGHVVKLMYGDVVIAVFNQKIVSPQAIVEEAREYLKKKEVKMMLERGLRRLSPEFKVKSEKSGFSLWYGKDHRLLLCGRGELTEEEILRLAKDYLKRHPELA